MQDHDKIKERLVVLGYPITALFGMKAYAEVDNRFWIATDQFRPQR